MMEPTPFDDLPTSLDDLVRTIEENILVRDGVPSAKCPTGEPYVVIGEEGEDWVGARRGPYPGVRREECRAVHFQDLQSALASALKCYRAYLTARSEKQGWKMTQERQPRLYWRRRPELLTRDVCGKREYNVYMRLIVTDLPEQAA